jgi:[ribosomal protein S18]-alanine N-acetyltransferase
VEFALREFRLEDFEVLWSIDQRCFPPGIAYPRKELAAYIQRRGSFTIVADGEQPFSAAKSDSPSPRASASGVLEKSSPPFAELSSKRVAGFIVAEASRRGVGHIITIDVLPDSRRSGLGSKLLAAAEARLLQAHCHTVALETAVDNASALAFYKGHHYRVVKVIPRYYSTGVGAFVLEKQLLARSPAAPER